MDWNEKPMSRKEKVWFLVNGMVIIATVVAVIFIVAAFVQGCGADDDRTIYDVYAPYYQPCHDACEAANEAALACGLDPVPREACLPVMCDSDCRAWQCTRMLLHADPRTRPCDELRDEAGWPYLPVGDCWLGGEFLPVEDE